MLDQFKTKLSAIKRKFGDSLRSKTWLAMENEILAKVVCFNLTCVIQAMYELGIDPNFVIRKRCTTVDEPAQRLA